MFASAAEAQATQAAVRETPRLHGEDIVEWLERVNAAAAEAASPPVPTGPVKDVRLPYARQPGEEG
jgi:hypothetical protein